jgi:adenosylhomocysteine nucleosidase
MNKIAIICAMEEELNAIIKNTTTNYELIIQGNFVIYKMKYHNYLVYLTLSGIGKVNSAITTQYIINKFEINYVINVGVAGSLSENLKFGDVVIAEDLVQYDVDVTAFGLKMGQIPRMDVYSFPSDYQLIKNNFDKTNIEVKYGKIISGDKFIDDEAFATKLAIDFNAIACEMEGAAVAHTCFLNKIPVLIIRSISDFAGRKDKIAIHSFNELKEMAALKAGVIVDNILTNDILQKRILNG